MLCPPKGLVMCAASPANHTRSSPNVRARRRSKCVTVLHSACSGAGCRQGSRAWASARKWLLFGVIVASMAAQHAKWLEACGDLPWRAPIPSLNTLLTSTCWRNDHNGFSHQGPGFMDTILSKKGTVARIYLPPDANCLLSVADHCLRSKGYVNLIIIDKQPQLQWLSIEAAREHCARGASVWDWASNDQGHAPDVVLACAGDSATLETVAAAAWLRENAPS